MDPTWVAWVFWMTLLVGAAADNHAGADAAGAVAGGARNVGRASQIMPPTSSTTLWTLVSCVKWSHMLRRSSAPHVRPHVILYVVDPHSLS